MLNPHFRDMLCGLSDEGVEFLVVGAYALAMHGLPRATGDLDLWVRPETANAEKVMRALKKFGAPLLNLKVGDLTNLDTIFQIGVIPNRIDLLTDISGVTFDEAWASHIMLNLDGLDVPVLSWTHLLQNKEAAKRPKDLLDAKLMRKRKRRGSTED